MALKGRYIVELREKSDVALDADAARSRMEGDAALADAARKRARYGKDDRWWSVGAGIIIVVLFIFYSANLKVVANILAIGLCAYLAAVFGYIFYKRAMLRKTDVELSPGRTADAFFRQALGMPPKGRDVTRLLDRDATARFSRKLAAAIIPLMRSCGVDDGKWALTTETNLRFMESAQRDEVIIPIIAEATVTSESGAQVEFIIEMSATFAGSANGDYIMADNDPEIIGATEREPRLNEQGAATVTFKKCPGCGLRASDRFITAHNGKCPACGGEVK